ILLGGLYLLAALNSLSPYLSFWGSYEWREGVYTFFCCLALFWLVAGLPPSGKGVVISAVVLGSIPVSLYALSQFGGLDVLGWAWPKGEAGGGRRAFSTLGHPNFLGAYLAMVIPLAAGRASSSRRAMARLGYVFLLCLLFGALFATFSRSAWLACFSSMLAFALLLAYVKGMASRFLPFIAAFIIMVLASSLLAYLDPGGMFSHSPLEPLHSFLRGKSATAQVRALAWEGALRLISARPLLGYGPGTFPLAFAGVYPPSLASYGGIEALGGHAHNLLLDWAVSIGLAGVAVYLLFLGFVFRRGWRALHQASPSFQATLIGLFGAIIAYLVYNQLNFATIAPLSLFWVCMGMIGEWGMEDGEWGAPDLPRYRFALYGFLVLAALGFIAWGEGRPLLADVYARQGSVRMAAGDVEGSLDSYRQALKLWPEQARYRRALAAVYLSEAIACSEKDSFRAAETQLQEAIRVSPLDAGCHLDMGWLYYHWGLNADRSRLELALEAYNRAAELSPSDPTIYVRRGLVYQAMRNYDEAIEQFQKALALDIYNIPAYTYLGDLYIALGRREEARASYEMARQAAEIVDSQVAKR
ncbi:MAG: tetratricopeptide repeat protein, partial [Anaerolineae bacterium]